MPSSVFFRHTAIACVSACLAMPAAFAAELGEISVQSFIGQPLSADIELTALAPDELQGIPVRLASADVYQGGGIGMDAALQTLAISQVERGGRRFVHVGTRQPINAGHVHLYLVLGSGSHSVVRLATVWLAPAPPVAVAPVAPVAPAPVPVLMAAPKPAPPASAPVPKPVQVPDAATLAARARAEGMVRPPSVFVAPPAAPRPAPPTPLRRVPAPVAACAPQAPAMPAEACMALDRQNVALNDKIGELEGKVAVLQKALTAPAAPAAAAPVASGPPHAKARAAAAADKKSGGNGLLWLGLGTVLFLLLTGVIVYVLRKRKQQASADARPPSKYWVLLRKPFRRQPKPVVTEPVADVDSAGPPPEPEPEPFSR